MYPPTGNVEKGEGWVLGVGCLGFGSLVSFRRRRFISIEKECDMVDQNLVEVSLFDRFEIILFPIFLSNENKKGYFL